MADEEEYAREGGVITAGNDRGITFVVLHSTAMRVRLENALFMAMLEVSGYLSV